MTTTYTLPNSTFYTYSDYSPIVVKLDEVDSIYRDGHQLVIIKLDGKTIVVRYNNEFEVDLIVADLTNKLKEHRTQSV